jgi:3-hydroxyisobutyrate dehydrogenase-like beta-hydroxyacid dehydrogenase
VIAYIGMGLLGSALAENLGNAAYTVRGFDIAPERMREHEARGGLPTRSPADAARGAAVVMTCLMTADLVRDALFGPEGAIDAAAPGVVVIDNSTIHPDASAALAARLAARGIPMLDAPVAGSSGQARRREAPVMVGGEAEIFGRCRPILDALSERVRHVGPNGAGARAKLVVNLVLGLNRLALAEGLLFGLRQGLDGKALLAILKDSSPTRGRGHQGRAHDRGQLRGGRQARAAPEGRRAHAGGGPRGGRPAAGDRAPPAAPARRRDGRPGRTRQLRDHRGAPLARRRTALKSASRERARSAILAMSSLKILVGRRDPAIPRGPRPQLTLSSHWR